MRILVTGAGGYLGQGIVKQLYQDKMDIIAVDVRFPDKIQGVQYVQENIFELRDIKSSFRNLDAVLHLAWRDGFLHNSEAHIMDLPKHYSFLKEVAESGISKLSVLGSMHEIGFYEGCIDEHTPANPQCLYGISKYALHNTVKLLAKQNHIIHQWIRGFYIVGNGETGCSIFSKITQASKRGDKKFPFTMGTNQFDFIDYDTFCLQVAAVVEQMEINGTINCCSGIPERLGSRVERYIKENGYQIRLEYGAFPDRPYDSKAIWGNNNKIVQILNNRKKDEE